MTLILLSLLRTLSSPAMAEKSLVETRVDGGYYIEARRPCNDFSKYKECWPDTLPATVFDEGKKQITVLPSVYYNHYHPFECRGYEIFWIEKSGDVSASTSNWKNSLMVRDLRSGKDEELLESRGIDFRASPDGRAIVYESSGGVFVLYRSSGVGTNIANQYDLAPTEEGFTLLQWSSDGTKFWFGAGSVEGWGKLALFRDGKVSWLNYSGGFGDEAFDPDRGWLVTSDAPFNYDTDTEEEFKKAGKYTTLVVIDVFTGKEVKLAKARANQYRPFWDREGFLRYSVNGKTFRMSKEEISGKLK